MPNMLLAILWASQVGWGRWRSGMLRPCGRCCACCGCLSFALRPSQPPLLLASQANAVPTLFWLLGFLLLPGNQRHLEAVLSEAQAAAGAAPAAAEVAGTPAAAAKARAQAHAAAAQQAQAQAARAEGEPAEAMLLTDAQKRGLVALASDRRSHLAAAVSETLRLRSFRLGGAGLDCMRVGGLLALGALLRLLRLFYSGVHTPLHPAASTCASRPQTASCRAASTAASRASGCSRWAGGGGWVGGGGHGRNSDAHLVELHPAGHLEGLLSSISVCVDFSMRC